MRKLLTFLLILFSISIASAQWVAQQSNMPADVHAYRISVVNETVVWATGQRNYLNPSNDFSRTIDGGEHWIAGKIPLPANFFILNISACSADTAWAAVGSFQSSSQAGIYKTIDGGKNWTQQLTISPLPSFVHFFNAHEGLTFDNWDLGGYIPIYTTSDGGANWIPVPIANNIPLHSGEGHSTDQYYCFGNDFYSATNQARVLKTSDKGKTWSVMNTGAPASFAWPSFKNSLNGMIAATTMSTHYEMRRTNDGGQTWSHIPSPDFLAYFPASIPETDGGYIVSGCGWGLGKTGSALTMDNGSTWVMIDDVAHLWTEFFNRDLGWSGDGNSNRIYKWSLSSERKITVSPNRISFSASEVGQTSYLDTVCVTNYSTDTLTISNVVAPGSNFKLANPPVLPVKLATLQTLILYLQFTPQAAGNLQDSVLVISDASNAPSLAIPLKGTGVSITKAQPGTMYAASSSLHTINTTTGTATAFASLGAVQIHSLAIRPSTMGLYGVCGSANPAVLYRIDGITGGLLSVCTIPKSNLRPIAFSPSDTLYAGNMSGELYRIDLKTGDAKLVGVSSGFYYAALAFHPLTGQLWASFTNKGDKIYTVDTQTGAVTLVGATGDNVRALSLAFSSAGMLYGIKGTGTQTNTLISIDTNTGAGTVLGSTGVTGLRTIAMSSGTTAVEGRAREGLPQSFALAQNYPNPFNAQTVIEYQLSQPGHVKLVVYNLLGQEIKTLINKNQEAGRFNLVWDGRDNLGQTAPSGIYFYRLQAEGFNETKKMLLLE